MMSDLLSCTGSTVMVAYFLTVVKKTPGAKPLVDLSVVGYI